MATTQTQQTLSPLDRVVDSLDTLLKALTVAPKARRESPAVGLPPDALSAEDAERSGALMRVNHAGEISAQGLYLGQALTACDEAVRAQLLAAAEEESDHLAWCDARLNELGTHPGILTPFWLLGSFAIGAAAGLAGDRASLGFVEETERQVEAHLESHDAKLPQADDRSRAILKQMRDDEARHAADARAAGGRDLPSFVPPLMRAAAKVMTTLAGRV